MSTQLLFCSCECNKKSYVYSDSQFVFNIVQNRLNCLVITVSGVLYNTPKKFKKVQSFRKRPNVKMEENVKDSK